MTSNPSLPADRSHLAQGTYLRDTYTVSRLLGRGRFADAYLVRHRYMGMQVMKLLVDGESEADRAEGLGEAFLLSKITHPGIVRVFDANRLEPAHGGHPYITMEHVSGGTLAEFLTDHPDGLILDAALEFGRQIAAALGHAHDLPGGLIHRDIKPANILLEPLKPSGHAIRVADFGLAIRVNRLTKVAASGGTLVYMSPESISGYETAASDVFSAGLVLYEMLTGTLPYPKRALADAKGTGEIKQILQALHHSDLAPPSSFDADIPPDVDAVTLRALHPDDVFRFPTGTALAHSITACQHAARAGSLAKRDASEKSELRDIFRKCICADTAEEAIRRLDLLTARSPEMGRAYTPQLHQMRIQWHRYRREVSNGRL